MSIHWELPNIGEGVAEADVAEILVSVGDTVTAEQPLMELETEKAVVELPAPHAGRVQKILIEPGDTLLVGQAYMIVEKTEGTEQKAQQPSSRKSAHPTNQCETRETTEVASTASAPADSSPTEMVTGSIDVELPSLGEGVNEADVAEVLVDVGDTVAPGDPLLELETEKAVVEFPSEHAGKITKVHVDAGQTVQVGQVIVTIETSAPVAGSAPKSTQTPPSKKKDAAEPVTSSTGKRETTSKASIKAPSQAETKQPSTAEKDSNGIHVAAAPSTRRLARQLGVDLTQVTGTGSGGRIIQDDVQAYVRERIQGTGELSLQRGTSSGALLAAGSLAPPPLPDFSKFGLVEREKMNKLARTAAENLTVSWNVIPHVTHHDRADITDLESARQRFGTGIGKNGPKVTMTAIVIKALSTCLQAYPKFNSSLDPETNEIVFKRFYNIGCAVDTEHGLLVPVIKNCDQKSILDIASELTELATKARDRKLPVDDMQGATCTVTNLGGIGGVGFTPIVNYPEVCILGMSRGQQELQLIEGAVQERLMLPLSLSYDHRVINGADAARFLATFCNLLADPFQLLTAV